VTAIGPDPMTSLVTRPAGTSAWGPNLLSVPRLVGDQKTNVELPAVNGCRYDIQVSFESGLSTLFLNREMCLYTGIAVAGKSQRAVAAPTPVSITNIGDVDIIALESSPSSEPKSFGPNRLSNPIAKGQKVTLQLGNSLECLYDFRAVFAGGGREERYRVNICSIDLTFGSTGGTSSPVGPTVSGPAQQSQTHHITLVNRYRVPVISVLASPPNEKAWGNNRLPESTVIEVGGQFDLSLPGPECQWDIRVIFDNEAEQEGKLDICPNPTVELTGPRPGILLSTGTGFFIGNSGYVLTNNHVVYGCARVTIKHSTGDLPLRLIGQDPNADLAILQESGVTTPGLDFRDPSRALRAGEKVVVLGYPLRQQLGSLIVTEGIVSSLEGGPGETNLFQMQAPVQPGNSGGPVFDSHGQVVGITVASLNRAQLVNFAVKADVARQFAKSLGVELSSTNSVPPIMATDDLVEAVGSRVMALNCYN